jgi:hypothetical protein
MDKLCPAPALYGHFDYYGQHYAAHTALPHGLQPPAVSQLQGHHLLPAWRVHPLYHLSSGVCTVHHSPVAAGQGQYGGTIISLACNSKSLVNKPPYEGLVSLARLVCKLAWCHQCSTWNISTRAVDIAGRRGLVTQLPYCHEWFDK